MLLYIGADEMLFKITRRIQNVSQSEREYWKAQRKNVKYSLYFPYIIHFTVFWASASASASAQTGNSLATLITNVVLLLHDLLSFVCSFIHFYSHTTLTRWYSLSIALASINRPQLNTTANIFRGLKLIPSFRWLDCLLPVLYINAPRWHGDAVSVKRGLQMR